MTVTELLRLAPFTLGIITLLLAAGGLLYAHAYGRYGDDAAIGFVIRLRFLLAAAAVLAVPALMLISFGRDEVPHWLTPGRAALLTGSGLLATLVTIAYMFRSVGRPSAFLSSVGRKVRVRRLNRFAQSRRWRDRAAFDEDLNTRQYRQSQKTRNFGTAGQRAVAAGMHIRRLFLRLCRTDHSEMLFDAAAAGARNGNMRTWRAAMEVIGERLRSRRLRPLAADLVVDNALVLEEAAHRYSSEDCKVRLALALGEVGRVPLDPEAAKVLGYGLSTLAERRLAENRPVNAVIDALESLASANPRAAVEAANWLGQHLVVVPPPAPAHGGGEHEPEHPTRKLFWLLSELADRAAEDDTDGQLNNAIIDACGMIVNRLPGSQDCSTLDVLAGALMRAGANSAKRYANGKELSGFGTIDAARELRALYDILSSHCPGTDSQGPRTHSWLLESIAVIGSWALGNREETNLTAWRGRSDMGIQVAQQLVREVQADKLAHSLKELLFRQHHQDVPMERREEFIGICQRLRGDPLGFTKDFDVPGLEDDQAEQQQGSENDGGR